MENLRREIFVHNKVKKINKKILDIDLKNIDVLKLKNTEFKEKFDMNKREFMQNLKENIGIAGKSSTKTLARLK